MDYNKYENGKTYQITDIGYNQCYIGSTCEELQQRLLRHRYNYTLYLKGKYGKLSSFCIFDEYGIDNCKIEWIEDYPCNSKKELEAREGFYIKKTECINKIASGRSKREKQDIANARVREDRKINKEKYQETRLKKRDICNERTRRWKLQHPEQVEEYNSKWRQDNEEHVAQKVICEICSSLIRKYDLKVHQKTIKCQSFTNNNSCLK